MRPFANDDSASNFESGDASAQTSEAKAKGADRERPGETTASRDRADGARRHAPDAGKPPADSRGNAEETDEKEIEVTREMIWAGLAVWFDSDREWDDPAEIVINIFKTMRAREFGARDRSSDRASEHLQSPFRSPLAAPSNLRR